MTSIDDVSRTALRGRSTRVAVPSGASRRPGWLVSPRPELALFATGLVIFSWKVSYPSPWFDEAVTLVASRQSIPQILATSRHLDAVHLVFYLFAHLALSVHNSLTSVRLISVVALSATAAMLAPLGRLLNDPRAGVLAGALLLVDPLASHWAQDARPYAMVMAVAVASTVALVSACRRPRRAAWWIYGVSLVALCLANVMALLLLLAHTAFVVTTQPSAVRRAWWRTTAVAVAITVPFLALTFGQRAQVSWITKPSLTDLAYFYVNAFGSKLGLIVMACLLGGGVLLVAWQRRLPSGPVLAGLILSSVWAFGPQVVLGGMSQIHPWWDPRYVLFLLPGLALFIAQVFCFVIERIRITRPAVALSTAIALVAVLAAIGLHEQGTTRAADGAGDDIRGAAQILAAHGRTSDAVLYYPYSQRVLAMIYPQQVSHLNDIAFAGDPEGSIYGVDVPAQTLRDRLTAPGARRVWVVQASYPTSEPTDQVKLDLPNLGYRLVQTLHATTYVIDLYEKAR